MYMFLYVIRVYYYYSLIMRVICKFKIFYYIFNLVILVLFIFLILNINDINFK